MVYFIQSVDGGPIKVGSSADPSARLRDMQVGRADELKILGEMPGGQKTERRLHRLLAPTKIRGEWFDPSPALDVLIHCAKEGIDLSPLIGFQEQVIRVDVRRKTNAKKPPKSPMKLSKSERKRRSEEAKKRHREGKLGGSKFGKLGGRPPNESYVKYIREEVEI